jgi:hypothetical protein
MQYLRGKESSFARPDSPFDSAQGRLGGCPYMSFGGWLFFMAGNKISRRRLIDLPRDSMGGVMPKYVIEREIPDAGKLTQEQIVGISQKSCGVLKNMGPQIQWIESFVTADKIYCVYIAPNEAMVREHAKQGGFPANRVSEVKRMIDPTSAEG